MPLGLILSPPRGARPVGVVLPGRAIEIGRGPTAVLRLPDPSVAERHATLRKRGAVYVVSDEGSLNGTLLSAVGSPESVLLGVDAPRVLAHGDRLQLGHVEIELRLAPPYFSEDEVELVVDPKELPALLVRRALESLGRVVTNEELELALTELWTAREEPLRDLPPPPAQRATPGPSPESPATQDRALTDWAFAFLACSMFSAFGWGIYWLLFRP